MSVPGKKYRNKHCFNNNLTHREAIAHRNAKNLSLNEHSLPRDSVIDINRHGVSDLRISYLSRKPP